MYFFLVQLSISDIMISTDIAPNLLYILLHKGGRMSLRGCIIQQYVFDVMECSECLLLTVMSYDRYVAICNPLHYTSIMSEKFCRHFTIIAWLISLCFMQVATITISCLNFCGPYVINHFFCDIPATLTLSCSDTFLVQLEMILNSLPFLFVPLITITVSYGYIISTILRIKSNTGEKKAFSTCSSHLMVVCILYVTLIVMYDLPTGGQSLTISKVLSLFYTVGTPLINPTIYSLRNRDIKIAFIKLRASFVNV